VFNYTTSDPQTCEFVEIAEQAELADGERLFIGIGDKAIVVFRIAGKLFAIADLCSHDDGPLGDGDLNDHEITCPRHGAVFDVHNGRALSLPAVVDIPAYPVRIVNGQIEVGLPRED
jgi:3-phenylpropionate/trans-cinnamate dioxygenase ferredoxin subunit